MSDRQTGSESQMGQEYLCRAQLLVDSLERAIQAIAENCIQALECEVQQQTHHCAGLVAMSRPAAYAGECRGFHAGVVDLPEDGGRVWRHLRVLTERYEAVLNHSGRTIRMLQTLNREASASKEHAGLPTGSSKGLSWLA